MIFPYASSSYYYFLGVVSLMFVSCLSLSLSLSCLCSCCSAHARAHGLQQHPPLSSLSPVLLDFEAAVCVLLDFEAAVCVLLDFEAAHHPSEREREARGDREKGERERARERREREMDLMENGDASAPGMENNSTHDKRG